jgi:gentisate 1,2-dioxygenase
MASTSGAITDELAGWHQDLERQRLGPLWEIAPRLVQDTPILQALGLYGE